MKDFLQDLVSHTHSLGVLPIIRVSASTESTKMDSLAEDHTIILNAQTHEPISSLVGVFGMTNMHKLDLHLKCPEYKENSRITLTTINKDSKLVPTGLHFENEKGDFSNDYRFMAQEIVDLKLKNAKFRGAKWDVSFEPTQTNIQRLKFQAAAHTEETLFKLSTKDGNLIISFGDFNTHAGSFVFQADVNGTLKNSLSLPKSQFLSVLNLDGNKTINIAEAGAVEITVDSGIAIYKYIFPAHTQ